MVNIVKMMVPANKYDIKCPYSMTPRFVVIHNTANDACARNEVEYMRTNDKELSFHYAVDDKEIVQGIEENRNAWHAGDGGSGQGNRYGIAIEICYSECGGDRFIKAERNAAELAASILKRYGWGTDKIKKHQDFSGKYCPHRTLDMGWERFVDMVDGFLHPASSGGDGTYTVQKGDSFWGIAASQMGDGTKYKELAAYNGMEPDDTIYAGQVLKIPGKGGSRTYTVKKGDSFWKIAQEQLGNGNRYNELAAYNGMKSTDTIYAGQVLKLPD